MPKCPHCGEEEDLSTVLEYGQWAMYRCPCGFEWEATRR